MSERITIETDDGSFAAYLARPSAYSAPAVVVIQEIFGINADMRAHCDALATRGYLAICPDLFWRLEPGVELTDKSDAEWQRAQDLYQRFDVDLGVADVGATIDAARGLLGATGKVGVVGFCMGGLLTFLSAARVGADAAVAYYGGGSDKHVAELGAVSGPMMMHLGEQDEYINADARHIIQQAASHAPYVQVFTYPGQKHAFARIDGINYNAEAADLANLRTDAFLERYLRHV